MNNISISVSEEMLQNIDNEKGLVSRSKFMGMLLDLGYKTFKQQEKKLS